MVVLSLGMVVCTSTSIQSPRYARSTGPGEVPLMTMMVLFALFTCARDDTAVVFSDPRSTATRERISVKDLTTLGQKCKVQRAANGMPDAAL